MIDINYEDKTITACISQSMRDIYREEKILRMGSHEHRVHEQVVTAESVVDFALSRFILADGWAIVYKVEND